VEIGRIATHCVCEYVCMGIFTWLAVVSAINRETLGSVVGRHGSLCVKLDADVCICCVAHGVSSYV
jgi:hypothetical protein